MHLKYELSYTLKYLLVATLLENSSLISQELNCSSLNGGDQDPNPDFPPRTQWLLLLSTFPHCCLTVSPQAQLINHQWLLSDHRSTLSSWTLIWRSTTVREGVEPIKCMSQDVRTASSDMHKERWVGISRHVECSTPTAHRTVACVSESPSVSRQSILSS